MEKSSAQGRFTVLDTPRAAPAVCGVCGYGGPERTYLDLDLTFEYYGALILCDVCVMSMSEMFGYILPAQARALEQRVEEAERELIVLRAATQNLENLSVSLSALGFSRNSSGVGNLASGDAQGAEPVSEESDSGEGSAELTTDESSDESGPDDVRDPLPVYDPFADIRT